MSNFNARRAPSKRQAKNKTRKGKSFRTPVGVHPYGCGYCESGHKHKHASKKPDTPGKDQ